MVARIEHDVAGLQVSVDDLHLAQVLEDHDDLGSHVLGKHVVQAALTFKELRKTATGTVFNQQVKFVLIFE